MQSRSNTMTATMPFANTRGSERAWRNVVVLIFCGAVLACGFFFAARQHFSSMELGIKNSQLRKQLADLEAENRRLSLAKEVAISPMAIRKASHLVAPPVAKPVPAAEIASLKVEPPKPLPADTEVKARLTKADEVKANIASKVVKAAFVKPAVKPQPIVKGVRKTEENRRPKT